MSLDLTCRCVYVLVSGWALNEEIGLEIRTKMVCGIKTKIYWSQGENKQRHVVPVQERQECFSRPP